MGACELCWCVVSESRHFKLKLLNQLNQMLEILQNIWDYCYRAVRKMLDYPRVPASSILVEIVPKDFTWALLGI